MANGLLHKTPCPSFSQCLPSPPWGGTVLPWPGKHRGHYATWPQGSGWQPGGRNQCCAPGPPGPAAGPLGKVPHPQAGPSCTGHCRSDRGASPRVCLCVRLCVCVCYSAFQRKQSRASPLLSSEGTLQSGPGWLGGHGRDRPPPGSSQESPSWVPVHEGSGLGNHSFPLYSLAESSSFLQSVHKDLSCIKFILFHKLNQ